MDLNATTPRDEPEPEPDQGPLDESELDELAAALAELIPPVPSPAAGDRPRRPPPSGPA